MKSINIILATFAVLVFSLADASAGDRQLGGLVLGGGAGAIVGQAIGRNTTSTVVGATVGGVLGMIVGNELERQDSHVYPQSQVVLAHSPTYDRYPRPVFRNHYRDYPRYRHYRDNCRKIVTIREGRYGSKKVVTTQCRNSYPDHYDRRSPWR